MFILLLFYLCLFIALIGQFGPNIHTFVYISEKRGFLAIFVNDFSEGTIQSSQVYVGCMLKSMFTALCKLVLAIVLRWCMFTVINNGAKQMFKQNWMVIVAGEALVDDMTNEQRAKVERTSAGFNSEQLCRLQRERSNRGVLGIEIVKSNYGYSVRYDSGLQNFGLLAGSRSGQLDGTLEDAIRYARKWVEADPQRRYAWMRK